VDDPVLRRLIDESRVAEAHHDDERRRFATGLATESATFIGALVDLAATGESVSVRLRSGRLHVGVVALVGGDFAVVAGSAGQVWCRHRAIAAIRVGAGAPLASGARSGLDLLFVDALALLVDDRPWLSLDLGSGEATSGELAAIGLDVITLRLEGGGTFYVPSDSLDAIFRSG
jgi:hypothetical protein